MSKNNISNPGNVVIDVKGLMKSYQYFEKKPGVKGSLSGLFVKNKVDKVAVKDFSFKVNEGEFIGLIGPNGAGKTTLIKMLTGIIQPTSGEVTVLGYKPSELKDEFKKNYSLVMGQKSQLWWDLPAIDSFILNKTIYEISDEEFERKINFFSELFNIKSLLNVQVRQLSLGERMKMELISCLLHNPKVIFLDEPTIGLDAIAQKQIREFLKDINKRLGITILLTSHYMEDIKRLCNRVVVINHGQKIYDGSLDNILNRFREYKTITVSFEESSDISLDEDVEWIEKGPYRVVFKIQKDRIKGVLNKLLTNYEVNDLTIDEEDIENLIEKMYSMG